MMFSSKLFAAIVCLCALMRPNHSHCSTSTQSARGTKECYDHNECANDNIYCYYWAACRGYASCQNANLTDNYNSDCSGDYGCNGAVITGNDAYIESNYGIHCDGNFGCQDATVDATGLHYYVRGRAGAHRAYLTNGVYYMVTGNWALSSGMIDSGDQQTVYIYLEGVDAASSATVLCREDSYCYLYCTTTSDCDSANITCYGSASDSNCDCAGDYCPAVNYISKSSNKRLERLRIADDIAAEFFETREIEKQEFLDKQEELIATEPNEQVAMQKLMKWNEEQFNEKHIIPLSIAWENNERENHLMVRSPYSRKKESQQSWLKSMSMHLGIGVSVGVVATLLGQKLMGQKWRYCDNGYQKL